MLLKQGVDIAYLSRPMRRALATLDALHPGFVLTSTRHDLHSAGSLHYADLAIDIRKHGYIPGPQLQWKRILDLLWRLPGGNRYQLVAESDHYHIEYDEG